MHISPYISEETRRFCQTTSVRGISRIFKSDSYTLTIIWLLGVLTCGGLMIWQLVLIFIKFSAFPVNTLFVESPDWKNPTFPDITICNMCPLVHESKMPVRYLDYVRMISRQLSYANVLERFHNISLEEYNNQYEKFIEPDTYFINFPFIDNDSTGLSPILDCNYYNWDLSRNDNCLGNIETIWNPDYYKCYRSRLQPTENRNVAGFSTILYVDDFDSSMATAFNFNLMNSRARGMKVAVHASGSEPDMKMAMSLASGTETAIVVHQVLRQRQPEPYSNCTTPVIFDSSTGNATYTQANCIEVCRQQQYVDKCKCISSSVQFSVEQLKEVNNNICGNLSIINNNSSVDWNDFSEMLCTSHVDENLILCKAQCKIVCKEIQYTTTISSAPWPHPSSLLPFYGTFIRNQTRFGSDFSDYEYAYEESLLYVDVSERVKTLYKGGLIQNNFLQLNIQFENTQYNEQRDTPAIPIEALGAQIGGVLSLWLGVTVMLVFEIGEFIYHLIHQFNSSRKRGGSSDRAPSEFIGTTATDVTTQKAPPISTDTHCPVPQKILETMI